MICIPAERSKRRSPPQALPHCLRGGSPRMQLPPCLGKRAASAGTAWGVRGRLKDSTTAGLTGIRGCGWDALGHSRARGRYCCPGELRGAGGVAGGEMLWGTAGHRASTAVLGGAARSRRGGGGGLERSGAPPRWGAKGTGRGERGTAGLALPPRRAHGAPRVAGALRRSRKGLRGAAARSGPAGRAGAPGDWCEVWSGAAPARPPRRLCPHSHKALQGKLLYRLFLSPRLSPPPQPPLPLPFPSPFPLLPSLLKRDSGWASRGTASPGIPRLQSPGGSVRSPLSHPARIRSARPGKQEKIIYKVSPLFLSSTPVAH